LDSLWVTAFTKHDAPPNHHHQQCLLVNISDDMIKMVDQVNQQLPHDPNLSASTFHFSTLYTKLTLGDIMNRMTHLFRHLVPHIVEHLKTLLPTVTEQNLRLHLNTRTGATNWTTDQDKTKKGPNVFLLSVPQLLKWISRLIFNTAYSYRR
jgi:hypothetical protein